MKLMLTTFFASLFFTTHTVVPERWIIEKSSNLCIEGRSNVNSFRCDVVEYLRPDTISFYQEAPQFYSLKGGLTIHVKHFDCHQRYMTGDLRKTLKADERPLLKVDLLSLSQLSVSDGDQRIKGWVSIELAGVTRKMEVDYTVQTNGDGTLRLCGSRRMLFSDFGLTPPHKLAGLIKVEEEINVRFLLNLRSLQTNANNKRFLWSKSLQ